MNQRLKPAVQQVYSLALILAGSGMILSPEQYPRAAYRHHFEIMPPRVWGVVFVTVGALAVGAITAPSWRNYQAIQAHLAQTCCALQGAVLGLWAILLFVAAADSALTVTYNGPIIWGAAAAANFVSLYRFGSGR